MNEPVVVTFKCGEVIETYKLPVVIRDRSQITTWIRDCALRFWERVQHHNDIASWHGDA